MGSRCAANPSYSTKYDYDRLNRAMAEKWYANAADPTADHTITFSYDAASNLKSVGDVNAAHEYVYDALNRITSVEQTISGLTPEIVHQRGYDAASRLTVTTAAIGSTEDYANGYTYDPLDQLGRISQIGNGGNEVSYKRVEFAYNSAHQLSGVWRYASSGTSSPVAKTDYAYDAIGRLEQIDHAGTASGSTFAESHGYAYDAAYRLIQYTNLIDGVLADYTYDNRGQLTAVDHVGTVDDESYEYDDNGNRETVTNMNGASQDYDTGTVNRLTDDGTYTYAYDNEGNRIERFIDNDANGILSDGDGDVTRYAWDHRNRLVGVTSHASQGGHGGATATRYVWYFYDAQNQLIRRELDPDGDMGSAIEQTIFVHDDGQVALQFDKTGAGSVTAADLSHRYLWGPAVDQLFADEQVNWSDGDSDGEVLWALTDHLGSVRDLVNNSGAVQNHKSYDAFGNVTAETNAAIDTVFGFTGKLFDDATGLQNNLNRWYDPSIGRWLSEDPIGFAAGDANLYRYVRNRPITLTDSDGLAPLPAPPFVGGRPRQIKNVVGLPGTVAFPLAKRLFLGGPDRDSIVGRSQIPRPVTTPINPLPGGTNYAATQQHHIIVGVNQLPSTNHLVGSGGAGPCIGVIICDRCGPSSRIFAAHFDATENPVPTIVNYLLDYPIDELRDNPPDVYIFGGDNSPASNQTLQSVVDAFRSDPGIPFWYIDSSGLWIDSSGNIYVFPGDTPNRLRGQRRQ